MKTNFRSFLFSATKIKQFCKLWCSLLDLIEPMLAISELKYHKVLEMETHVNFYFALFSQINSPIDYVKNCETQWIYNRKHSVQTSRLETVESGSVCVSR